MLTITAEQVASALDFPTLVNALKTAFASDIKVPPRAHFDIENPKASRETTLLIMPAWQSGDVAGVKLVTVAPENSVKGLASIQGTYLLFDVDTGSPIVMMDAPALTAKRTAAASALASSFLSRPDSQSLLMVGTGTLSPELIQAHAAVRPIKHVFIWGRSDEKVNAVIEKVKHLDIVIEPAESLAAVAPKVDIISCATLSKEPLILGNWLEPGQHLDMVGAYRPDMREMDDMCLTRSRIFVDNFDGAMRETGDIAIPLAQRIIEQVDIEADLFSLCKKEYLFDRKPDDITVFKSVGHALEDLAAAKLVAKQFVD